MFLLAWILFALSVVIHAPRSFYPDRSSVASGLFIVSMAGVWAERFPAGFDAFHFVGLLVFVLSLFTNLVFFLSYIPRKAPRVPTSWRVALIGSLVVNASLPFFFPFFAMLAGYWVWLSVFAVMLWTLFFLPAEAPVSGFSDDRVPDILWIWLGFTVFWLCVTTVNYVDFRKHGPAPVVHVAALAPKALTQYFNDPAQIVPISDQQRWNNVLAAFEKETSSQIAVAIYPHVPEGAVEDFTMQTAELSRLGRTGRDNGAILFLFLDRKIARIEVGYGLESVLTDANARRILDEQLATSLDRGEYGRGYRQSAGHYSGHCAQ